MRRALALLAIAATCASAAKTISGTCYGSATINHGKRDDNVAMPLTIEYDPAARAANLSVALRGFGQTVWTTGATHAECPGIGNPMIGTGTWLPLPTSSPAGTVRAAVWLQRLCTCSIVSTWGHESVYDVLRWTDSGRGLVLRGCHWIWSDLLETLIVSADGGWLLKVQSFGRLLDSVIDMGLISALN